MNLQSVTRNRKGSEACLSTRIVIECETESQLIFDRKSRRPLGKKRHDGGKHFEAEQPRLFVQACVSASLLILQAVDCLRWRFAAPPPRRRIL